MIHFLYRFGDVLVWYCVIPGYTGELLIHVTLDYLKQMAHTRAGRKAFDMEETLNFSIVEHKEHSARQGRGGCLAPMLPRRVLEKTPLPSQDAPAVVGEGK